MIKLLSPVMGRAKVSSLFREQRGDRLHWGVDFALPERTSILASANMEIVYIRDDGDQGYGLWVLGMTKMPVGWNTNETIMVPRAKGQFQMINGRTERVFITYAHLDMVMVAVGQDVPVGQIIGLSGNTGRSSGPHLHYQVNRITARKDLNHEYAIDPLKHTYFKQKPIIIERTGKANDI